MTSSVSGGAPRAFTLSAQMSALFSIDGLKLTNRTTQPLQITYYARDWIEFQRDGKTTTIIASLRTRTISFLDTNGKITVQCDV